MNDDLIGRSLAHYRILEAAGSGSMGAVYLAEDARLKRRVALKLLPQELAQDPERLTRFRREAETLASIDHPNIVTIFSVEEVEGLHFFTMTWIEGRTLDRLIPAGGLDPEVFLAYAVPLANALTAAHERGITHRDLKPANIMVTPEGSPVLLDFGLAKKKLSEARSLEAGLETETEDGLLLGTLPYMSPEQVRGLPADQRSDVFSFGTMLYEMATGERPFHGASGGDLLSAILRDTPPPVDQVRPELSRQLGRIIQRCLRKDPDRRFQTSKDLRNELEDLRAEERRPEAPEVRRIAVLPFSDMSAQRDQQHFCDGIAEEIINALTCVASLRVVARGSSFQFRSAGMDVREIGCKLDADAILDGSVRKAGERLRITVQLVNVADGYHLWSERFDRGLEDIFAVQEEIARSVVDALKVNLSPKERDALTDRPTADLEAYDYHLRGRQYLSPLTRTSLGFAAEMFQRAVEIDPEFAPAWAGIAEAHSWLYSWHGRDAADLEEAEKASRRAVELAPDSAEAHASLGWVLSCSSHSEEAAEEFETAVRLNPRLWEAYYFYGRERFGRGEFSEAAELFEKAAEVRPEDYQALLLLPQCFRSLGLEEKEMEAGRRGLERVRRHLQLHPDDARALYLGAGRLLAEGERETAFSWIDRAEAISGEDPVTLYNIACFYALAGEAERALDALEKAAAAKFGLREWIEKDSDLDGLRDHPRFQAILDSLED